MRKAKLLQDKINELLAEMRLRLSSQTLYFWFDNEFVPRFYQLLLWQSEEKGLSFVISAIPQGKDDKSRILYFEPRIIPELARIFRQLANSWNAYVNIKFEPVKQDSGFQKMPGDINVMISLD